MIKNKIREHVIGIVEGENRDIALLGGPGMGITSVLRSLDESYPMVWISTDRLCELWESYFKLNEKIQNYIIHAATIEAIVASKRVDGIYLPSELYKTNLPSFLEAAEKYYNKSNPIFIVIDGFDKLSDPLALIICNELKRLDDQRDQGKHKTYIGGMRFIVGGYMDFCRLYGIAEGKGSPATNFAKCRAHQFLLSEKEARNLLIDCFPSFVTEFPVLMETIVQWSNGHIYYLKEFSQWLIDFSRPGIQLREIVLNLENHLSEKDRIKLFYYCYKNWEEIKVQTELIQLLKIALDVGFILDTSGKGHTLSKAGFLLPEKANLGKFYIPNKFVELFIRQRLAENKLTLPINQSSDWAILSLNVRAYKLILEIENRLRNYIGSRLYMKHGDEWITRSLSIAVEREKDSNSSQSLAEKTFSRMEQESKNDLSDREMTAFDTFVSFLDFGDLHTIIEKNPDAFSENIVARVPELLSELSFYRRRIAHNRPITEQHLAAISERWQILQKILIRD